MAFSATQQNMSDIAQKVKHFSTIQAMPVGIKLALYPMERVRLLMQTQHLNQAYKGTSLSSLGNASQLLKKEGMLSPWKGVTPTLVRWFPSQYIHLFMKDAISQTIPTYVFFASFPPTHHKTQHKTSALSGAPLIRDMMIWLRLEGNGDLSLKTSLSPCQVCLSRCVSHVGGTLSMTTEILLTASL